MKKMKIAEIITISIVITMVLVLSGCGNTASNGNNGQTAVQAGSSGQAAATTGTAGASTQASQKTFTLSELKKYNGQNGNPAYIAIDGTVYDVTNVREWKNGIHQGYQAGQDLTDALNNSPHGASKLAGVPTVGKLAK